MQMRTVLIGAFALMFGISAAVGVYILGNAPKAEVKAEMVSVVIAAVDISRGDTISPELIAKKDWPKEALPEGAMTDTQEILDRTLTMSLVKGDLIVEAKLAPKGAGRGLAAVILPGMRAFTIQTPNVATGVAGFVLPGNRVDVLLTMTSQGTGDRTGGGTEITLLQNVEILAVDQRIDTAQERKANDKELRSVTLMVTPGDAAKLDLGHNRGTLHLVLRNPADQGVDYVDTVTVAGLHRNPSESVEEPRAATPLPPPPVITKVAAPPAPRPKKRTQEIRTLRGSQLGSAVLQMPPDEVDETPAEEPRPEPPPDPATSPAESTTPTPSTKDA
jgi:pilus assembly protein CpaB